MGQIEQISFQVGGSLASQAASYIHRQADTELYDALTRGELCYVLNARQMGKSSLLVQTRHRLHQAGYRCSVIDITNIGSENITPVQWYTGLIYDLWRGFKLLRQVKLSAWKSEESEFSFLQRLSHFIGDVLLEQFPEENLVIFIDEIDSILSLPFPVDDFFALIRFCYNQRAINPAYKRLNFALFGVATPSDLIRDRSRTPFNIGRPVELTGFTYEQAQPLASGLTLEQGSPDAVLKAVLNWTGGQPFLTQKLCQLVVEQGKQTAHGRLMIPAGNEGFWVDSLVRDRLLKNWETQDEPEHLRTIRNRILNNTEKSGRLLGIYQQVLTGETVLSDDSPEQTNLLLSGLVVKQGQQLHVKNPIYAEVFNPEWVAQQLGNLRPYSQLLKAWTASGQTDESRLLRGQALTDAQQWAQGKQLSDLDYQYLAASVECDRTAVQEAMQAEKLRTQLQQEQQTAQLQRRFLLAVSAALLSALSFGTFNLWQFRQVRLSEIQALTAAAEGSFDSHRQLQAMYQALQASTALNETLFPPPSALAQQLETVMNSLVDRTAALSRIDIDTRVMGMAIHPKGDLIAVVGADGQLTAWRPSGKSVDLPNLPTEGIADVAFSPDGERVAIALESQTLEIWQMDGKRLTTVENLPNNLRDLRFGPDGKRLKLSVADRDKMVIGDDGQILFKWRRMHRLEFHPDGRQLVSFRGPQRPPDTGGPRGRSVGLQPRDERPNPTPEDSSHMVFFDEAGQSIREFMIGMSPLFAMAVSPDGRYIAMARVDGNIQLWSPDGTLVKTFFGHSSKARVLAFSADGQRLASGDSDGVVNLWQVDGSLLSTFSGHEAEVEHLAFSPDYGWLLSGSEDGSVRRWQVEPTLQQTLAGHTDAIHGLAFTPDGQQLFSLSVDQSMKVWQRDEEQTFSPSPANSYRSHNTHHGFIFSPDSELVAKIHPNDTVQIMRADSTPIEVLETGHVGDAAFTPDGQQLVVGGRDQVLTTWQRQPDDHFVQTETWGGHDAPISEIAISPTDNLIVSGAEDHTLYLWREGERIASLDGHTADITALTVSPDGNWIASGSADNTVRLWRPDGTMVHTLTGHGAAIRDLTFSPDSRLLVSASTESTLKVWQPDQPEPFLRNLTGHKGYLTTVTFSPDGELLASAGVDRRILLWRINEILQVDPLDYACQWLDDYLQHSPVVEPGDRRLCQ